jgi:hypothetical protein
MSKLNFLEDCARMCKAWVNEDPSTKGHEEAVQKSLKTMCQQLSCDLLSDISTAAGMMAVFGQSKRWMLVSGSVINTLKENGLDNIATVIGLTSQKPSPDNLETLQSIQQTCAVEFGAESKPALAISYTIAWFVAAAPNSERYQGISSELESLRGKCEGEFGQLSWQTIACAALMARVCMNQEDFKAAKSILSKVLKTVKKGYVPYHPYVLEIVVRQAQVLVKLDSVEEAKKLLLYAAGATRAILGRNNTRSQRSQKELIEILLRQDRDTEIDGVLEMVKNDIIAQHQVNPEASYRFTPFEVPIDKGEKESSDGTQLQEG